MKEITKLEDIKHDYSDIIDLKRPLSYRKKMSMEARAAQFAPFAALTGYGDEIKEKSRITSREIELSEDKKMYLDNKLVQIQNIIDKKPLVKINYFVKDIKKEGGKYIEYIGSIKKVDNVYRQIIFDDKKIVLFNDIIEIDLI